MGNSGGLISHFCEFCPVLFNPGSPGLVPRGRKKGGFFADESVYRASR